MEIKNIAYSFNCIICGASDVGKTSICYKYFKINDNLEATIGVQLYSKVLKYRDNDYVKIRVWDFSGLERFRETLPVFYNKSLVTILTYDASRYTTFQRVVELYNEMKKQNPETKFILVENMNDLDKSKVTYQKAIVFKQINSIPFLSVSAISGENIELLFSTVLKQADSYYRVNPKINNSMIRYNDKEMEKKQEKEKTCRQVMNECSII